LVDPVIINAVLFLSSQLAFCCGTALLLQLPGIRTERSEEEGLTTAAQGTLEELPLRSEGARQNSVPASKEDMFSSPHPTGWTGGYRRTTCGFLVPRVKIQGEERVCTATSYSSSQLGCSQGR